MEDKFIILEQQKNRLKNLLTKDEYDNLIKLECNDFYDAFSKCIDVRYIDDAPTKESDLLEDIYYEIYNKNNE